MATWQKRMATSIVLARYALDDFVEALATRIASFDKWAIANTKRLVNAASLPPDVEIAAGWEACMTSIGRPAAQPRIRALLDRGFQKAGDVETHLGCRSDNWEHDRQGGRD